MILNFYIVLTTRTKVGITMSTTSDKKTTVSSEGQSVKSKKKQAQS